MMTFQMKSSLHSAAAASLSSHGGSRQRGPAELTHPTYSKSSMGAGGRQAAFTQNTLLWDKLPAIQPLNGSKIERTRNLLPTLQRDYRVHRLGSFYPCKLSKETTCASSTVPLSCRPKLNYPTYMLQVVGDNQRMTRGWRDLAIVGRSPNSAKDFNLESDISDPKKDFWETQLFFDHEYSKIDRIRTVPPTRQRDYRVHRPGNFYPCKLSKEQTCASSTVPLSSRPKLNYPTYMLQVVGDNRGSQSFPDPMVGAPRSFIHRVTELSFLEGETVRQENLKKKKKPRKQSS